MNSATLDQALEVLGQLLSDREQHYEVVAVGGASLLLIGQMIRPTKDLDLIALVEDNHLVSANPLPFNLIQAAEEVGKTQNGNS